MGIDRTIYLEAYVKIPIQHKDFIRIIKTCGEHENNKGDNFCPICGDEIIEQSFTDKYEMWIDEIIGNENLWSITRDGYMYLFSNIHDCGISTEMNEFYDINSDLIKSKISKFQTLHDLEIKTIESRLGHEVNVCFGFMYEVS